MAYVIGETGARKLREVIRGVGASGSVRGARPDMTLEDEMAHPYAVRWSASANGAQGSWIIYLPTDLSLLVIDGVGYSVTANLEEVGGDYPEGWYLLDDLDFGEKTSGPIYAVVEQSSETGEVAVRFSVEPHKVGVDGTDGTFAGMSFKVCDVEWSTETGERKVLQYVTSAIYQTSGNGDGLDENTLYFGDSASITLATGADSEDGGDENGNIFQIAGFGKYSTDDGSGGTYREPTEVTLDAEEASDVAFLARTGNTSEVNGNALVYVKLKGGGGGGGKSVFRIEGSGSDRQIVDCYYNVGGVTKSVASANVSELLAQGSLVTLNESTGAFEVFHSVEEMQTAQKNLDNYIVPLYLFDGNGEVQIDFRNAPQIQKFEVF